ncbi:uncharacterized protein UBRO_20030 [Ustilago bromivora]|uniref:Retrovirus-related Pol polyprotein from transposon TNT 1-94-like beta-barrel domain-containing protein n=1 Tax=Ustilago bromivora TaxID=307758 RepID=A0A1K0H3I4_9BASI|nr:uncharacterized protein UBRO_20030 [Ustilago bromivora]
MPPHIRDSDTESSDLSDGPHKERPPAAPRKQMLIGTETPVCYDSDDDNSDGDETHYNIDTISNLNPEVLKGMPIELTKCNKAKDADTYKKPSHCSNFHQRLSCTHDILKEAPKLTTKNCALLTGNNNVNYLFVRPTNPEPWSLHNPYGQLKKDLTKMEKIAESTLLNEVRKIHMFQADIHKLIADINKHWAKAESMGHALPKILKVKTLIDQAKYVTPYHHCVITLEDTGMASDYEVLCAALCKHQDSMTTRTDYRVGNVKMAQANLANRQVQNEEAYHRGKPGPDGIQRCYHCNAENHKSRYCPKEVQEGTPTKDPTSNQMPAWDTWCTITSVYHVSLDHQSTNWIVDSGATDHVMNNESNLISSTPCNGFVKTASGMRIHIIAVGQAMLNVNGHEVPLNNVLYVPDSNANLISVKALTSDGACVIFDSEHVMLELPDGTMVTSNLNTCTRHYEIPKPRHEALMVHPDDGLSELPKMFDNAAKAEKHIFTLNFMHEQCSHPGRNKSRIIEKLYKVKLPDCECQDCIAGKLTKAQMGKGSSICTKDLLELVHIDLTTHLLTKTEFTCLLVAIDDASSFTYVKLL